MAASQGSQSSDDDTVVIPIDRSFSDGKPSTWPKQARFGKRDDSTYREKVAKMWLQKMGAYEEGVNYAIDRLPAGYALFDRPRRSNPETRDKFVWGHPSGQHFSSTKQFFPHFYYLMTGGNSKCSCQLCAKLSETKKEGRLPYRAGRKPEPRPAVDSKRTPDVYRTAVKKLKAYGTLDERITEPESMDWRAERKPLQEYLTKLGLQASYVPRAGEIVLWDPALHGNLSWNFDSRRVEVYSQAKKRWLGTPQWRAGIIGQTPEDNTTLQDLVEETKKSRSINYSGFRIETFPDPNSRDKSYSLHYKYVPLKCIKPFSAWELFLQGTPREAFHPSIEYALTVMSSFSLLEKYHLKGTWPNMSVYAQGIFIGAELLNIGDAVRLKPPGYTVESGQGGRITDIMVIENIKLNFISCTDNAHSEQLAKQYTVRIQGQVYTTNRSRAQAGIDARFQPQPMSHDEVVSAFRYVGMSGYGKWYRLNPVNTKLEVTPDMVLGRCYEPDAMELLFGSLSFGLDAHGILSGRSYSQQVDERIPEGKRWFWGDFRTETLGIDSLNGLDVGHYSEARDVVMWRANLKVIDGTASTGDIRKAKIPGGIGRLPNKSSSTFAELNKTSTLVRSGLGAAGASNPVSSAEEGNGNEHADEESESDERLLVPLPYVRGGTEETESGDYDPDGEPKPKKLKHRK